MCLIIIAPGMPGVTLSLYYLPTRSGVARDSGPLYLCTQFVSTQNHGQDTLLDMRRGIFYVALICTALRTPSC